MSSSRSVTRPVSLKAARTVVTFSRTHHFGRQWPRPRMTRSDRSRQRNLTTPFWRQSPTSKTRLGVTAEEQPAQNREREVLVVDRASFESRSNFSDALNRGRLDIARGYLSQMDDVSILDYNQVMQLSVAKKQHLVCQQCFTDLTQRGITPNIYTYSILLNHCVQRKDLEQGKKVVELLNENEMELDAVLCNLLIKLYMVCNEVSRAMEILNEMKETGIEPNIITYNYILGGHCRPSNGLDDETVFERVQDLFKEMREEGISPDARTYAALSRAALRVERIDLVKSYIKEITKSGFTMKEADYVVLIYSFASRILTKQQDQKIALSWNLLLDMRQRGLSLSPNSLDAFTTVYASFKRLDLVFGIWNYYQNIQMKPVRTTYLNLLKEVSAKEFNRVADQVLAQSFIQLMDEPEVELDREMIEYLMQLMVKHKHPEGALKYLREMQNRRLRPKLMHYNFCLRTFVEDYTSTKRRRKMLDLCMNLLKEMKQNSILPNDYTYFAVLRSAIYNSNWTAFLQVLDLMKEAHFQPSAKTCGGIINGCSKMEDTEFGRKLAWEYFEQIKKSGQTPSVKSYTIMMNFCVKVKDYQKGIDVFNEMQGIGIQPTIQAYTTLLCLYGDSGDLDKAFEVFEEIKSKGLGKDKVVYHCMIRACGMADRFDKAIEVFSEMKSLMKLDSQCYGSMIFAAGSCRRSDWVMQYYDEMMMNCVNVLISVYNGALRALIDCKAFEDARRVMTDMESTGYRPNERWRKAVEEAV